MHTIELTHTFDAAHRVVGHLNEQGGPGKCSRLHGHTYTVKFQVSAHILDETGFVVDFARLKALADEWDHRLLLWQDDPLWRANLRLQDGYDDYTMESFGAAGLPFNPTSENMATYLANAVLDLGFGRITHSLVELSETPKSKAIAMCNIYERELPTVSAAAVGAR